MTTTSEAPAKKRTVSPWRGDPVDRRAQEVVASEFRRAWEAQENINAITREIEALVANRNGYINVRDSSFGVISELRFNITEAQKILPLIDEAYADINTDPLVEMARRVAAHRCSACRRNPGGKAEPCDLHKPIED